MLEIADVQNAPCFRKPTCMLEIPRPLVVIHACKEGDELGIRRTGITFERASPFRNAKQQIAITLRQCVLK